ncbi:hypothetical protein [uncultured Pseudokineococcus sp.]|uniref:hypothetical protein n=1 Tax=uncultured Pseudokineococcus sp. TaxID=1642928 RepID=UPI002611B108|nr:hypothetical protein [uncultured Pseudokineococcus sp.]
MRSTTEGATDTVVGRVAWHQVPHAGFVMARANSPIPRRWGGDLWSLPYAALLGVFVVLSGDQVRTAARPGRPGRAVLLLTPTKQHGLTLTTLLLLAGVAVLACAGTLVALVLLPTVAVAGAVTVFLVLVLLEVIPAAVLAWRTRALGRTDRQAEAEYPHAALLHWVSAYPCGEELGSTLLEATLEKHGTAQALRLSTRTERLTRWYAQHGFEVIASVNLPGAPLNPRDRGATMVRTPCGRLT